MTEDESELVPVLRDAELPTVQHSSCCRRSSRRQRRCRCSARLPGRQGAGSGSLNGASGPRSQPPSAWLVSFCWHRAMHCNYSSHATCRLPQGPVFAHHIGSCDGQLLKAFSPSFDAFKRALNGAHNPTEDPGLAARFFLTGVSDPAGLTSWHNCRSLTPLHNVRFGATASDPEGSTPLLRRFLHGLAVYHQRPAAHRDAHGIPIADAAGEDLRRAGPAPTSGSRASGAVRRRSGRSRGWRARCVRCRRAPA